MPIETGQPSVKARAGSWQVAQATVPSADKRPSKNSFWPRAIFSGVCGLSCGITFCVGSNGRPTWLRDLGLAWGPALGIGGGFPVVCSLLPTISAMPVATTTARRPQAVCFRKGMAGSDLLIFLGLEPIANCTETRLTLREILSWHPRRLTLITSLE